MAELRPRLGGTRTSLSALGTLLEERHSMRETLAAIGLSLVAVCGGASGAKVYGDTAILTCKLALTTGGAARHSRFRKVFIRREGRWFLVSLQGVALPNGG